MPELRSLCTDVGCADVQTYIQSGNLVFRAEDAAAQVAQELEAAIERRFGLLISIVVRAAADWSAYRFVGSPVTTRNWRTVLELADLVGGLQARSEC